MVIALKSLSCNLTSADKSCLHSRDIISSLIDWLSLFNSSWKSADALKSIYDDKFEFTDGLVVSDCKLTAGILNLNLTNGKEILLSCFRATFDQSRATSNS